jgi:hypothetical protein
MANASTNLTGAAREVQVLKIDGYSASKSMCTAKKGYRDDGFIESRWNVGGYEWEVRMYPATVIFGAGYTASLCSASLPNHYLFVKKLTGATTQGGLR